MTDTPDLARLIEAVAEMRHCQREYFRTRSGDALSMSKRAEKRVDALLAELSEASQRQGRLF